MHIFFIYFPTTITIGYDFDQNSWGRLDHLTWGRLCSSWGRCGFGYDLTIFHNILVIVQTAYLFIDYQAFLIKSILYLI